MRASLRSVYRSDVDVHTYVPDRPEDDGLWIRLMVGPADSPGDESFDVLVCTPLWLRRRIGENGPQIGRHRLIVDPMNLQKATDYLRGQVEALQAPNWRALAEKIARLGHWEFEDYRL